VSILGPGAWVVWLVVAPLAAAIIAFALPRLAVVAAFANALCAIIVSAIVLFGITDGPLRYSIGGWGAPLGIDLFADPLAGVMLTTTAIVMLFVTIYAPAYLKQERCGALYWPLSLFLHAALNALFLSGDIFNVYVALELLGIAAVALVALAGDARATAAALRYLLASLVASLAYLLGVALLYHAHGAIDIATLSELVGWTPVTWAALGLMTSGLVVKGALVPMHFWLPEAHSCAPSPVSALLSSLVVKAPFYVLLRLWLGPFLGAPPGAGDLLGVLGVAAIVWGSVQALRQARLKLMVAYSTVAQIGYLFLFFPMMVAHTALQAVTVFMLAHALAKAAMFLAVGNIQQYCGHDRVDGLQRVAREIPLTLAAFGIGGICIVGLPPSGNFIAKWLLIEAAYDSGEWGWSMVIVAGSLLSAAYVFRVLGHAFTVDAGREAGKPVSPSMAWPAFVLSLVALMLGLASAPVLDVVGAPATISANAAGGEP
jgi:formate hydrogenlyase subunit 3/multisubunit Na+/H+ antiporter MnhD subunit